jgi:hypothetical protein
LLPIDFNSSSQAALEMAHGRRNTAKESKIDQTWELNPSDDGQRLIVITLKSEANFPHGALALQNDLWPHCLLASMNGSPSGRVPAER